MKEKWSKPIEVKDIDLAFGGSMEKLLPKENQIPPEFWSESSKWNLLIEEVFYNRGLNILIEEKEGVDSKMAGRHIRAILASFEPKHEHKMAGCSYLASLFFEDVTIEGKQGNAI